jgi:5-methylcytosine-specific restriction endonuclease McrA
MESDGKCYYCADSMAVKSTPPYYGDAYSMDHKRPISCGGNNDEHNIVVCCCRCNLIKGTMSAETYQEVVELIRTRPGLLQRLFVESSKGRLANKITRERNAIDEDV